MIPQFMLMRLTSMGSAIKIETQRWVIAIKLGHREEANIHAGNIRKILDEMHSYPQYVKEAA